VTATGPQKKESIIKRGGATLLGRRGVRKGAGAGAVSLMLRRDATFKSLGKGKIGKNPGKAKDL